ncbi:ead/Ea22-like family protein [Citrobacter portucalensis]|uniref:Ead/Ea22-like family protein n=1 Tax=Citrobacter portucalensis TaxID=1639133 RepID=A0AAW7M1U2_9ENTR|nr:ead/Ea22-like family protein [Citrobacter portucalensis]MDN4370878.1 ead/Ea22-like family protein [Citrobacter portucalensis]MHV60806.1 ead/Ea22-like family protein [Escherichia coli]
MTALNKQALREAANAANIASWGQWESYKSHKGARGYEVKVGAKAVAQHCLKVDSAFIAAANPPTVLALLDELEAAEKRVDELEVKLETSDKLQDSAFRHGLQHGFSYGQTDNQAGFEQAIQAYGQQWKGE